MSCGVQTITAKVMGIVITVWIAALSAASSGCPTLDCTRLSTINDTAPTKGCTSVPMIDLP